MRAKGAVIELDEACLAALSDAQRDALANEVRRLFARSGFEYSVSFAAYRVGSAFLHPIKIERSGATPLP